MGIDEIVQDPVTVDLGSKTYELLYVNAGWRFLVKKYETVTKAIDALQKVTPRIGVRKGDEQEDGTLAEKDVYVTIPQDEFLFETLIDWLYAGIVGKDKTVTRDEISDAIDAMNVFDFICLRVSVWKAFAIAFPTEDKDDDSDPTKKTDP